jgi:uncharacterized protein (DUF885 family)
VKEVARIQGEMRGIMKQVKFKGDLQAFFEFVRTDAQFYLPQAMKDRQNTCAARPRSSTRCAGGSTNCF